MTKLSNLTEHQILQNVEIQNVESYRTLKYKMSKYKMSKIQKVEQLWGEGRSEANLTLT